MRRRAVRCSSVWRRITNSWKKNKKKNSCEKWCPKFKATSIRIHFSAWWIIEHQPEQPWVLALFVTAFAWIKHCLACRAVCVAGIRHCVVTRYRSRYPSLRLLLLLRRRLPLHIWFRLPASLSLLAISLLPRCYILSFFFFFCLLVSLQRKTLKRQTHTPINATRSDWRCFSL